MLATGTGLVPVVTVTPLSLSVPSAGTATILTVLSAFGLGASVGSVNPKSAAVTV
jgi:hypothetical protein